MAGGVDCGYHIFVDPQRIVCSAATAISVPTSEIKTDSPSAQPDWTVNPTQINLVSFGIVDLFKEK